MNNILLMPGARWQVELAKTIKNRGDYLMVIDPNPDAPCIQYADDYCQADVLDWEKVSDYCASREIDAVVSDECDVVMPVIASIGSAKGLNTLSVKCANLYTDKFLMRRRCQDIGLPIPPFKLCHTVDDAIGLFRTLNGVMVIKPLDNNASRGVFIVRSEDELRMCFSKSIGYSRRRHIVLAEGFVDGTEFTVDGLKTPTGHFTLAISEKKHFAHNPSVASELLFTHTNDRYDYDLLRRTNDQFVNGSGLEFGLTHAEYKFHDGKFYQMEIAARGGGTMISSIIAPFMSGQDTYQYLLDYACDKNCLGEIQSVDGCSQRAAILKFFSTPGQGGVVRRIKGLDCLKSESKIVKYELNFREGDIIRQATSDSDRIGYYIACCETVEQLNAIIERVNREFEIEYE